MERCCGAHVCDRCGAKKHAGLMVPHADGWPSRLCLDCEKQLGWFQQKCNPYFTAKED